MEILRIAGLALLGVFTALLLKGNKGEYSLLIGLAVTLLVCSYVVIHLMEIVRSIESVWNRINADSSFLEILLRVIGISYVTELTSGICKECGYGALAGQVTIAGKMGILLTGFPVFMNLLDFVLKLGGS